MYKNSNLAVPIIYKTNITIFKLIIKPLLSVKRPSWYKYSAEQPTSQSLRQAASYFDDPE